MSTFSASDLYWICYGQTEVTLHRPLVCETIAQTAQDDTDPDHVKQPAIKIRRFCNLQFIIADNEPDSQLVCVELVKSFCLPLILCGLEVTDPKSPSMQC